MNAILKIKVPIWTIEEETGYKPITTFWNDFSIADTFGKNGINNTFNIAFSSWKDNIQFITELALVLNHKCWYWYEKNDELSKLYSELYYKVDEWAGENLHGKDAEYYYRTLD